MRIYAAHASACRSPPVILNVQMYVQISDEAKDLIRRLLRVNPEKRLTLEQVLAHPWIQRYEQTCAPVSEYR